MSAGHEVEGRRGPTVADLEQVIRSYVNMPRRHRSLLADPTNFHRLCSAMDAIGDAEVAFSSYEAMSDVEDVGERYIVVYGILQLLFVEQDAVTALTEIFQLPRHQGPEIKEIREIRHRNIGHPVPIREDWDQKPVTAISRSELGFRVFRTMYRWPDGRIEFRSFNLLELIAKQRRALIIVLRAVVHHLRQDECSHRQAHRSKEMTSILHQSVPYLCSKIVAATLPGAEKLNGAGQLRVLARAIAEFRQALAERSELNNELAMRIDELSHPFQHLMHYFEGKPDSKLEQRDAYIFSTFVTNELDVLMKIAKEIDEEYAKDDPLDRSAPIPVKLTLSVPHPGK